jgi:parallel beta-helix repeat protein
MKRLLLSLLMMLVCSGTALATSRQVPAQYTTIQAAIDASAYGDVVVVAAGTYSDCTHPAPAPDGTLCVAIMKSGVSIQGAGPGITIIDALGLGRGIYCNGVVEATIEGLTIRGAFALEHGAGIYCYNGSSPTIQNCVVRDNTDGGIIIRWYSNPTIRNVTMSHNFGKEGGGLYIAVSSNPIITSCFVDSNSAPIGGGVSVLNSAPQFRNSFIRHNAISGAGGGWGGGLTIKSSTPWFMNCSVLDNTSKGGGGGAYVEEGTATFIQCTIMGNRTTEAYGPGGGLFLSYCNVTLEDCLIARNTVVGTQVFPLLSDGGGIRVLGGPGELTIRRCTIAANSAASGLGGGVSNNFCSPIIEQSIIANNSLGAGLYCDDAEYGAFTVSCTDIYGNAGGNAICGTDAGGNFSLNPLFCDLANNNFRLQTASPCQPGAHPNGPAACGGNLIGGLGGDCSPAGVIDAEASLALETRPNPFRGSTEIRFDVPRAGRLSVVVYDAAGREVRSLVEGVMAAGPHAVAWDGADASGRRVPSGVYFYRLSLDGRTEGRRVIVTR